MSNLRLPIGFDDFKEIILLGYYYVDKTWFIKELLDKMGKVNLFTRPRRFGKTLNLSMLRYYFERLDDGQDNSVLFDRLKIMQTISFFDYAENYYHGFLTGLLKGIKRYRVESNRESGTGHPDLIMRENKFRGKSVIIEIKVAKRFAEMEEKCQEALQQVGDEQYDQLLLEDGYQTPQKYGICFFKKGCLVQKA